MQPQAAPPASAISNPFEALKFQLPFRKYQRLILSQMDSGKKDRKYHIVAPPGSGKTIIGLELIRRFGTPAVVFAPTTTIQKQWQEKVSMFTADPSQVNNLTSLDPTHLAPINIFTYQLISTPGEQQDIARQMALRQWVEDLLTEGQVTDEPAATARIETIRQNNPDAYQKEIARRYRRIKQRLLREEHADIESFLHPNARKLIQDLLAAGVRTVVLDECHHLLDYWAIVLRHLVRQIQGPHVVGLTATLPSPEDDEEYENYTSLLEDVDFEVPTPAVVKEGDLAPYRDLVYFVEPSKAELDYLHNIQKAFETAIAEITATPSFRAWLVKLIVERPGPDSHQVPWQDFLNANPQLSIAGLRALRRTGYALPPGFALPTEAEDEVGVDDWVSVLERYALDHLTQSADKADHEQLAQLRRVLQPFGLNLTERGLRQGRSAGDLILALSESKATATATILAQEDRTMGPRLRAVVVTDFERMTTGVEHLRGVLERDAGSAWRVFRTLAGDVATGSLEPILVTGKTLMVKAERADSVLRYIGEHIQSQGLKASCSLEETPFTGIVEVVGEGPDWSPGTYVRLMTEAFDEGLTRCLVGTRGIFGEGWDSLSLNTLIDLTSVTTSTSVQQLRGRTIRKDPTWPRKVAHNWDVVCVATDFKRGDSDLRRFIERHKQYWGVVPPRELRQDLDDAGKVLTGRILGKELGGQIVKGVSHVDPDLDFDLSARRFDKVKYERYNKRMTRQVPLRDRSYDFWGIGQEYSNFSTSMTRLEVDDLRIRTVFTVSETLKRMLRQFRAAVLLGILLTGYVELRTAEEVSLTGTGFQLLAIVLVVGFIATLVLSFRSARRLARAFFVDQPPDAILLDVGRALLASLRDTGQVSKNLQPEFVRTAELPDNSYQVFLDYASPTDAATFIQAYRQIFGPVRDQRYLILRDDSRLPQLRLAPFWFVLRRWYRQRRGFKPAYHPVPDILATRKEYAETFAGYWRQYVGGGRLVYTRTEMGRGFLLVARTQSRPKVPGLAFETWR